MSRDDALALLAQVKELEQRIIDAGQMTSVRIDDNTVIECRAEDVEFVLERFGVEKNKRVNNPTLHFGLKDKEVRERIADMWVDGYTVDDIKRELNLNCSKATIRKIGVEREGYSLMERNARKKMRYGTAKK
jgi:hypothetical protein